MLCQLDLRPHTFRAILANGTTAVWDVPEEIDIFNSFFLQYFSSRHHVTMALSLSECEAIARELSKALVGGFVQKIHQPRELTFTLDIHAQ